MDRNDHADHTEADSQFIHENDYGSNDISNCEDADELNPRVDAQLDDTISAVENEVRDVRLTMENVDRENVLAGYNSTSTDTDMLGGARAFKLGGKTVFVNQAQSYVHHGAHFVDYSPAEFESIVDVHFVEKRNEAEGEKSRGRKRRTGFLLRQHIHYILILKVAYGLNSRLRCLVGAHSRHTKRLVENND